MRKETRHHVRGAMCCSSSSCIFFVILVLGYYDTSALIIVDASSATSSITSLASSSSPLEDDNLQEPMYQTHESGVNLKYEWRILQLRKLAAMIGNPNNLRRLQQAGRSDLGRTPFATIGLETFPVEGELRHAMRSLKKWMKPNPIPSSSLTFPSRSYMIRKPLPAPGILIIGAYNYPAQTVLRPLVGALAAGNPVVIKPSEKCPETAKLLKELIEEVFDPAEVQVVLGGIPETSELLSKPWSKVVFTGSGRVGKIVAESCAKTMAPTLLELGGKCPLVVDETVSTRDLQSVAERIVFGKFANAGQTCLAVDTLLVHESHVDKLSECLLKAVAKQFGFDPKINGELGRIVSCDETKRITNLIREVELENLKTDGGHGGGVILCGGSSSCDIDDRYVAPTIIILPKDSNSKLLQEEIFGPVLPIVPFSDRSEAIQKIQTLSGIPLNLYVFTPSKRVFCEYTDKCRSAGSVQNDCLAQGASSHYPLGGLGSSGIGRYGGKHTFEAFSHPFHVLSRPLGSLWDFGNFRCHPYAGFKERVLGRVALKLPGIPVLHLGKIAMIAIITMVAMIVHKHFDVAKFVG